MGRPSKLTPELLEKAKTYISTCQDQGKNVNLPTAEGLCLFLSVARSTLYEWSKDSKDFSDILEEVNQEQVRRLIAKGLSGDYNSNIAKLVLAKHGYKEQLGLSGEGEGEGIKVDINVTAAIDKIYGEGD